MRKALVLFLMLCAGVATRAQATPIYVDLGTGTPPATLDGFSMLKFPPDGRPLFTDVTTVPTPIGGDLAFSIPMNHRAIGSGWATWSNGYTGDVYYTDGADSVSVALPASTGAFYFYTEPNPMTTFTFTVTAADGTITTVSQAISGAGGARGFGFYTPDDLLSVSVSSSVDFAIGEFGIAEAAPVPEPATLALFGVGVLGLVARYRRGRQNTAK